MDTPIVITEHKWPSDTQPVVSIFNWVYNHKDYIRESIDSILMQKTTFRVEIIIHDDASNDGTAEIIKEYEVIYPKLFNNILQKENQWSQGKSVMTPLFERPKGKYVALAHGDDYWTDPHKLQKQVELLERSNDSSIGMIFHNAYKIYEGSNDKILMISNDVKPYFDLSRLFQFNVPIPTASLVFRRDLILDDISWIKNCQAGDYPLLSLLLDRSNGYYLNDVMSVYRKHAGGVSIKIHQNNSRLVHALDLKVLINNVHVNNLSKFQKAIGHEYYFAYIVFAYGNKWYPRYLLYAIIYNPILVIKNLKSVIASFLGIQNYKKIKLVLRKLSSK